jgi:phosphatidyl-myo-inositol alpha-mannosyltransferase
MRIAIVSPYTWTVPSGVNNHILCLRHQLETRGHDVWVIAPAGTIARPAKNLPTNFVSVGRSIPVRSNGSVAYANAWPLMMQRMEKIFARHHFDLIHVHEPTIPSVGAAATMASRVPVVGTFHAAGEASGYYRRWKPLAERILAGLSVRIAVSESARECVGAHFPEDYQLISNGIDLSTYAPAQNQGRIAGRILFVGRPEPRKGLPILIDAFSRLRARLPHASLMLVGPTFDEVSALASKMTGNSGLLTGVHALGPVSDAAKLEQMGMAEVMCAPALGGESFGMVVAEALAAGLPVVASDIPGYRAVLAEGEVGVIVPPGEPSALAGALFATLHDEQNRAELSRLGSAWVEQYSWDRIASQIVDAYQLALSIGPRVVQEPAVPVIKQVRHLLKLAGASHRTPSTTSPPPPRAAQQPSGEAER